jgi:hypothetical protein
MKQFWASTTISAEAASGLIGRGWASATLSPPMASIRTAPASS